MSVARSDPALWGRMVETAVGAHLINAAPSMRASVTYWRDRDREVDLVFERGASVVAIEVTSGRRKSRLPGLDSFFSRYQDSARVLPMLVGGQGMAIEEFLSTDPADLFPA